MEYPGKRKCEVLKDIRRKIAESEGIKYAPAKCNHEGDCPGTCPRCEAEVEYLEREIARKHGRSFRPAAAAAIGGLMAATALTSCFERNGDLQPAPLGGDVAAVELVDSSMVGQERMIEVYFQTGDSSYYDSIKVVITKDMVGDDLINPEENSALWRAIEEAKKNK